MCHYEVVTSGHIALSSSTVRAGSREAPMHVSALHFLMQRFLTVFICFQRHVILHVAMPTAVKWGPDKVARTHTRLVTPSSSRTAFQALLQYNTVHSLHVYISKQSTCQHHSGSNAGGRPWVWPACSLRIWSTDWFTHSYLVYYNIVQPGSARIKHQSRC